MFYDTDAGGVVHNIAYLRFVEKARTLLGAKLGLSLKQMSASGLYAVVTRTEIDYLNGLVVQKAAELGLPVPANEGIAEVVRQIERGEIRAGPDAIAHL